MKVIPAVQGFETKMIELMKDQEKWQIIIRRFDEVILEKASKSHIKELHDLIKLLPTAQEVQDVKKYCNDNFDKDRAKFSRLEEGIDLLGKSISKEILNAVKKATAHLTKSQEAPG